MRNRSRLIVLATLGTAFAAGYGCSSDPAAVQPADLKPRLRADTGVDWDMRLSEENGEVRFLGPEKPVRVGQGNPEQMARAFFAQYKEYLHGTGDQTELRAVATQAEENGTTTVRFEHYLPGTDVRVLHNVSTAHFTKDGELYYAQPGFRSDLGTVSSTAVIRKDEAIKIATERASAACNAPTVDEVDAVLSVRGDEALPALLVWRVPMVTRGRGCVAPEALVDASTGQIVSFEETARSAADVKDVSARGVRSFEMDEQGRKTIYVQKTNDSYVLASLGEGAERDCRLVTLWAAPRTEGGRQVYPRDGKGFPIITDTLGKWFSPALEPPTPGSEVDAHFGARLALRYFKEVHNRHGIDNNGGTLSVLVYDESAEVKADGGARHAIEGQDHVVRVGLDDGDRMAISAALDIMVHEVAHGVIASSSHLSHQGDAGALNESFADVMGACAEHELETKDEKRNLLIGEQAYRSPKGFLRDIAHPRIATFESVDRQRGADVHDRGSLSSLAFKLMAVGGVHPDTKMGVASPMGWVEASKLWYRTFTNLHSDSTFRDAALAQVRDIAVTNPKYLQTVACGWASVGVLAPLPNFVGLGGIVCKVPQPPSLTTCDGRGDAVVCNSQFPWTALVCKEGKLDHVITCSGYNVKCSHKSETDWTATVDALGYLACL